MSSVCVSVFEMFGHEGRKLLGGKQAVSRATRLMPSPGQEAMCPRDWAEKIFCLTPLLEICPSPAGGVSVCLGSRALLPPVIAIINIMFQTSRIGPVRRPEVSHRGPRL